MIARYRVYRLLNPIFDRFGIDDDQRPTVTRYAFCASPRAENRAMFDRLLTRRENGKLTQRGNRRLQECLWACQEAIRTMSDREFIRTQNALRV